MLMKSHDVPLPRLVETLEEPSASSTASTPKVHRMKIMFEPKEHCLFPFKAYGKSSQFANFFALPLGQLAYQSDGVV